MKAFAVVSKSGVVVSLEASQSLAIFREYDIAAFMISKNLGKGYRIKEVEMEAV